MKEFKITRKSTTTDIDGINPFATTFLWGFGDFSFPRITFLKSASLIGMNHIIHTHIDSTLPKHTSTVMFSPALKYAYSSLDT